MSNLFEKPSDIKDYVFRITDNGGATADRYTVVFCDGDYLGLSSYPSHPQGFSQWGEGIDPQAIAERVEEGTEVDLALGDLPKGLLEHVIARCNEATRDFLESVEQGDPKSVSSNRDDAEENDGTYNSFGVGIYRTADRFWVKLDNGPDDDRGPYNTPREAVLATLPDAYSLSGPEYQPDMDVSRLEPDPEVAAKIAALEAKVDAGPETTPGV